MTISELEVAHAKIAEQDKLIRNWERDYVALQEENDKLRPLAKRAIALDLINRDIITDGMSMAEGERLAEEALQKLLEA